MCKMAGTDHFQRSAVLTIAGSDSSGGAGIQADIKTMMAYGVYGMSVITAVTAQNTCGVSGIENISAGMIEAQIEAVMEDIPPGAVKIGMLSSAEVCRVVRKMLEKYSPKHVVLDPVMVATSGSVLLEKSAQEELKALFPSAEIITPNIPEAEVLTGSKAETAADMERMARKLYEQYGCAVLIKGGHRQDTADDLLYHGKVYWYSAERIDSENTHGTGCTLSSAIASGLALGHTLEESVEIAKQYVRGALSTGLNLGRGNGPTDHGWKLQSNVAFRSISWGQNTF